MQHRPRKAIKPGKHTIKDRQQNKKFRDSQLNHEGYLICECCKSWNGSDADHIGSKGSHPELRYEVSNKRILCRPCHNNRTGHIECSH